MSDSFVTTWTVAHQAPLSMGFFRQKYESGFPFPSPGDPPNLRIKPVSCIGGWILYHWVLGKPQILLFCCSVAKSCLTVTPWTAVCQASLSFTVSQSLLKFMSIKLVIPSNHLNHLIAAPFSFYRQSFPASGSFPMIWLFISGGQNIVASASASVLPMKIQGWFL